MTTVSLPQVTVWTCGGQDLPFRNALCCAHFGRHSWVVWLDTVLTLEDRLGSKCVGVTPSLRVCMLVSYNGVSAMINDRFGHSHRRGHIASLQTT